MKEIIFLCATETEITSFLWTFSSLAALELPVQQVMQNFVKMTTFSFRWQTVHARCIRFTSDLRLRHAECTCRSDGAIFVATMSPKWPSIWHTTGCFLRLPHRTPHNGALCLTPHNGHKWGVPQWQVTGVPLHGSLVDKTDRVWARFCPWTWGICFRTILLKGFFQSF